MFDKDKVLGIIWCLCVVGFVQASQKKGISGWPGSYHCLDFKLLNNMTWLYDRHADLGLYIQHMRSINCSESVYQKYLPEYVPTIYTLSNSSGHQHFAHFTNVSTKDTKYILGFNEPDMEVQANMSPKEAADRWPEIERDSHGIPLVSPAPAKHNFQWLDSFFQLCNGCRVDYVAAHAYSCDANAVMTYLRRMYHRYGKKIWLTEFGCPHSRDRHEQLRFMKDLLPKLEAADFVFRYAWFQARIRTPMDGGFMNPEASLFWPNATGLTPLGHFYNEFQGDGKTPQIVG